MLDFHNDDNIKFEYEPVNNKFQFDVNVVGASAGESLAEASITYTDVNSIFVSDTTGNDSTGTGDLATPYKTILKGINSCTTARIYVIVLDSIVYAEDITTYSNAYFSGIYAATGETPVFSRRVPPANSDSDTIYVSDTTGNDSTGDGTYTLPYKTIAKGISECDTAHNQVGIIDSATYNEPGIKFTDNFTYLFAYKGTAPTLTLERCPDEDIWGRVDLDYSDSNNYVGLTNGNNLRYYKVDNDNHYFEIYDSNLVLVTAAKKIGNTSSTATMRIYPLQDAGFVTVYDDYFIIYGSDGVATVNETQYTTNTLLSAQTEVAICTDTIVIAICGYLNAGSGSGTILRYVIDLDGNVTETNLSNAVVDIILSFPFGIHGRIGYGYCLVFFSSLGLQVINYDESTTTSTINTSFSLSVWNLDVFITSNGNRVIVNYNGSSSVNTISYYVSDKVLTQVKAETVVTNTRMYDYLNTKTAWQVNGFNIGGFIIEYRHSITEVDTYLYDNTGTAIISMETHTGTNVTEAKYKMSKDIFSYVSTEYVTYYKSYQIVVATESTINGIILDAQYQPILDNMLISDSVLEITNCTFKNNSSFTGLVNTCIETTKNITFSKCIMQDSYGGIFANGDTVTIEDSSFFRINGGYPVSIDFDSSPDGTIEHCTFFNCYGGIELVDNDGTEVIKNNIFHQLNSYSITAETVVTYSYSLNTDSVNNASQGSSVILANPLFINEGAVTASDIDLDIKTKVLGYPTDSPALSLADDSRDAGAYWVARIGSTTTWTSATIQKDPECIKPWHQPVAETRTIRRDGSVETSNEAFTEYLEISWKTLVNADYLKVLAMIQATSNQVRVYPDPTTNPAAYNTYKLVYNSLDGGADGHFKLTRTGKTGIKILLARAYE